MALEPTAETPAPDIKAGKVGKSAFFASLDNWGTQIIQLVTFIHVGNVIGPEAVGIMATALLVSNLMYSLLVNSFTEGIVQRPELDREHQEAAYWGIVVIGLVAACVAVLVSYPLSILFSQPLTVPIVQWLAPTFFLFGLISFYQAKIRRDMRFGILAFRSIITTGIASACAITAALHGWGVWSLVLFQVVWRVLEFLFLLIMVRWLPRLKFSWRHFKELNAFGGRITLVNLTYYFDGNIDRYMVGAVLGEAALGIYMMARRMVDALTFAIAGVLTNVSMSLYSRLQTNRERMQQAYLGMLQISTLLTFPVFGGLAVVAEPLVKTFLEPQWAPMIPLLQIFCLMGALHSANWMIGIPAHSLGRADITLRFIVSLASVRVVLFTIAIATAGLIAMAWVNAISLMLGSPFLAWSIAKLMELRKRKLLAAILPGMACTLGMVAITEIFLNAVHSLLPIYMQLIGSVVVGVVSYALLVAVSARHSLKLALKFIRKRDIVDEVAAEPVQTQTA